MQCEILTSFAGAWGSFSAGQVAEIPDDKVAELDKIGRVKPCGKPAKRRAAKKKAETPSGEGD